MTRRKLGKTADHTVLKVLLDAGAITPDAYEGALHKQQAYGGDIEEVLLDTGVIDEQTLLNHLATHYKTKFVHSDKLKNAQFAEHVLGAITDKVARQNGIFPIAFDIKNRSLSVITANPGNLLALQEVEKASGCRKLQAFLARPAAVKAAIQRWYDRDIHAFAVLDREDVQAYQQMMDVYERNVLDETSIAAAAVTGGGAESTFSAEDLERRVMGPGAAAGTGDEDAPFTAGENYLNSLHILVGLLENDRAELRGHSVGVSRSMRQMAERIRLSQNESVALGIAGALHDLGKFGLFHLTALNVAQWQGHWEAAASRYTVPTRLFEPVQLPLATHHAVDHMYERYDGSGFPEGFKSKDIPLGARILAIVDSYSDLTANPKNSFRRVLDNEEALQAIGEHKGTIFDPMLVEVFGALMAGEQMRDSILAGQNNIVVLDTDPEQAIILELNLASQGFQVEVANNPKAAMEALVQRRVDLLITEVDLKPIDGFDLVQRLRGDQRFQELPVIFFTSRSDQKDVARGFEVGAVDYVVKPSSVDVLVAKVQRSLQARSATAAPGGTAGGVSGSLREMDLPDLVQVLSQGRKNGALRIQSPQGNGEIHFADGKVVNAVYKGKEGEQAFYEMLHITDGNFQVDAAFKADRTVIKLSVESLLLEGMRLLDEAQR